MWHCSNVCGVRVLTLTLTAKQVKAMYFEHARRPSDHSIESFQRQKARAQHQTRETLPLARCAPRTPASKPRILRSEWEREYEAGCWYWRNVVTGELTDVCPFPDPSEDERLLDGAIGQCERAAAALEAAMYAAAGR